MPALTLPRPERTIPLPAFLARTPDKPRPSTASRSSGHRRAVASVPAANILLVDDHPPNLMALEAILEPLGERLVRASSGVQAVEIAAHEDFALILLDLQMPQLDGFSKATRRSRDTLAMGYASGAVEFLYEPLDPDVLRAGIARSTRSAPPRRRRASCWKAASRTAWAPSSPTRIASSRCSGTSSPTPSSSRPAVGLCGSGQGREVHRAPPARRVHRVAAR